MTKAEVNKLLALMQANYSNAFRGMGKQEKYLLLGSWTFALQDIDADLAMLAAMKLISTSKWMPTVAEVREKVIALAGEAYELGFDTSLDVKQREAIREIGDRARNVSRGKTEIPLRVIVASTQYLLADGDGT